MVKQGDIFYVDFNPSLGHEQMKRRPAIALSNDILAQTSGMTIVAPISSTTRNYPAYYKLPKSLKTHGKILFDQTTAFDLKARNVFDGDVVEHLAKSQLKDIIDTYKLLFSID